MLASAPNVRLPHGVLTTHEAQVPPLGSTSQTCFRLQPTRAGPPGPSARPRGITPGRSRALPTRPVAGPVRRPASPHGRIQPRVATGKHRCLLGTAKDIGGRAGSFPHFPICSPPTCPVITLASTLPRSLSSRILASTRPNISSRGAIRPVHPVWWLAPSPAPLSPWKYS